MSKMKYVLGLIEDQEYYNLKFEITKAKTQKKKKFSFRGETLSIITAEAMLSIMKTHINQNH
jgi:hypothetical protein